MAINFRDFGNKLRNADARLRIVVAEHQIQPTDSRERFFSSDTFQVGSNVTIGGALHEIIDKRSNYVVAIDESGVHSKHFHTELQPTDMKPNYKSGTYKGIIIPTGLQDVLEQSDIVDPFGIIKIFESYRSKNYKKVLESADKLGLNLNALSESVDADHQEAIDIVAAQLGIELSSEDTKERYLELKKKLANLEVSPENHEIYHSMIQTLHLMGLDHLYDAGRSLPVGQHTGPKHTQVGHGMGAGELNAQSRKMRVNKLMNH